MRALVTGGAGFIGSHLVDVAAAMRVATTAAPARPGEIYRSCLRPERAHELVGWEARTGIREGIERMLVPAR